MDIPISPRDRKKADEKRASEMHPRASLKDSSLGALAAAVASAASHQSPEVAASGSLRIEADTPEIQYPIPSAGIDRRG